MDDIAPMAFPGSEHLATAASFAQTSTSIISDCLERLPGTGLLTRVSAPNETMAGLAYTVRVTVGDNAAIHEALRDIAAGQVLVVDGGGDQTRAVMGGLMLAMAEERKIAGIVVDGAVRDWAELSTSTMPIYARGFNLRGPFKNGPGARQIDVTIGGMVVHPGDVIVGDRDGLISFPLGIASDLLQQCRAREEFERDTLRAIRTGSFAGYGR